MERDSIVKQSSNWATRLLGLLTILFLAYVLTSALNWRAKVELLKGGPLMTYSEQFIPWLPHSFDANQTWKGFWRYLGLAATFWAGRSWLLGRSKQERRSRNDSSSSNEVAPEKASPGFPPFRIRLVLWTLILSSSLLALVGITQRLDGAEKLLWSVEPAVKQRPGTNFSFGPFAYRANGSQYFNLVWPIGLGFWWVLRERYRRQAGLNIRTGGDPSMLLIPLTGLMAAVPMMTGSRGGFYILAGQIVGAILMSAFILKRFSLKLRIWIISVLVLAIGFGSYAGGEALFARFEKKGMTDLSGREVIWNTAHRMADDFPLFGSGAETFPSLNYLYRDEQRERWHGYVHDDYLETRLSMGWIGFGLVLAMLALALGMGMLGAGTTSPSPFRGFLSLGILGLLIHARADFPLQVVGILFTFIILVLLFGCCGPERSEDTPST
jgi:O-antigen ligase